MAKCDLCEALRVTPWYYEDELCWIAECEICEVPMVVWREHGTSPPPEALSAMHARLREVAETHFGAIYIDDHMRNIPDHYHAHGRPEGGFWGRDFPARSQKSEVRTQKSEPRSQNSEVRIQPRSDA